jgi:beta-lactamase class D
MTQANGAPPPIVAFMRPSRLPLAQIAVLLILCAAEAGCTTSADRAMATQAGTQTSGQRTIDLSRHFPEADSCFVMLNLASSEMVRHNPGRCAARFSPCSTFKIPNALIGLETGAIPDAEHVIKWDGKTRNRPALNQDHTLRTSMPNSVVWYYQELARRVGPERMEAMLAAFDYGNHAELDGSPDDVSNRLTSFWLDKSLAISADEQVRFLRRLHEETLPLSPRSMAVVKEITTLSTADGAILRGKTGSHSGMTPEVDDPEDLGWFVGWVEKDSGVYIFAANAQGPGLWGPTVRERVEAVLREMNVFPDA